MFHIQNFPRVIWKFAHLILIFGNNIYQPFFLEGVVEEIYLILLYRVSILVLSVFYNHVLIWL